MTGRLWLETSAMHKVDGSKLSFTRELQVTPHPLQESSKALGKLGLHLAPWWVVRPRLQFAVTQIHFLRKAIAAYTLIGVWMMKGIQSMKITLGVLSVIWIFIIIIVTVGNTTHHDPGKPSFESPTPVSENIIPYSALNTHGLCVVLVLDKHWVHVMENLLRIFLALVHFDIFSFNVSSPFFVDAWSYCTWRHHVVEMLFC